MRDKLKDKLRIGLIALISIIILSYTYYEARFLITGPELRVISPQNNVVVTDPLLQLNGKVRNISSLTINGRLIMITPDGSFNDKLLLLDGYNTIEIKVKNKFGQENQKILRVVLAR